MLTADFLENRGNSIIIQINISNHQCDRLLYAPSSYFWVHCIVTTKISPCFHKLNSGAGGSTLVISFKHNSDGKYARRVIVNFEEEEISMRVPYLPVLHIPGMVCSSSMSTK